MVTVPTGSLIGSVHVPTRTVWSGAPGTRKLKSPVTALLVPFLQISR